jgi:transposase
MIEPLLPQVNTGGRAEKHPRRAIVDAILYVVRTGCSLRQIPADFPPWQTAYWYFLRWEQVKVTEQILPVVRKQLRIQEGRHPEPSAGLVDSESVKGADTVEREPRGYDAGNRAGRGIRARRSTAARGSSSPTPPGCCSPSRSSPLGPGPAPSPPCSRPTCAPGCGSSSPTAPSPAACSTGPAPCCAPRCTSCASLRPACSG